MKCVIGKKKKKMLPINEKKKRWNKIGREMGDPYNTSFEIPTLHSINTSDNF